MSIWTIICLTGAIIFGLLALIFAIIKEKGAKFLPEFKKIPKSEIEKYDIKKMSLDIRDEFINWAGILLIGSVLSHSIDSIYGIIAFFLWLIIFIVKLFSSSKSNLEKYKKQ